jgi:nucleoside-diphosphate-sugar epimerase
MHNFKKQKVLITGSSGGVGSALIRQMTLLGWNVDGLDTVSRRDACWPRKSQFICHDLSEGNRTFSIVKKYDGVIHLAGFSRVRQSKLDPMGAIRSNILCTANILESIRLSKKRIWVLIASSLEVKTNSKGAYGLTNMYGTTKAVAELLAHRYVLDHGITAGAARIAGVYGSLKDPHNKVPLVFIKQAISNRDLKVTKDSRLMDYIHIDDVCDGLINSAKLLSKTKTPIFHVHKIYSHKKLSLESIARMIIRITNSKSKLNFMKDTKDVRIKVINKNKFKPKKDLADGLIELAKKLQESL